ncbi:Pc22g18700, partial [Penicillium rubens Wisconsin 54-1255]
MYPSLRHSNHLVGRRAKGPSQATEITENPVTAEGFADFKCSCSSSHVSTRSPLVSALRLFIVPMLTNLKDSRSLRLTVAFIISFALICYLYSWRQTSTPVSSPMQSPETGITGMGPSVSISVPPEKPSASDSHPTPSAAPIYTLPDKVWHKSDNLSENQREWTGSWTNKNPSLRQELLTDRSTEAFVRAHYFKTRPDIVE